MIRDKEIEALNARIAELNITIKKQQDVIRNQARKIKSLREVADDALAEVLKRKKGKECSGMKKEVQTT